VRAAQPIEGVLRSGERRCVDDEAISSGPRLVDDAAGLDHQMAAEFIRPGTRHRHASLERR
jgi:hypothetical protein